MGMVGLLVIMGGILSLLYSFKDNHSCRSWCHFSGFWERRENQDVISIAGFLESRDNMNSYPVMSRCFLKLRSPGPDNAEFLEEMSESKKKSSKWLSMA